MSGRSALRLAIAVGILLAAFSCEKDSPITPGQPETIIRLELQAPAEIPPGETAQLTANAVKANGSVENVTSKAAWRSTRTDILSVTAGVATAKDRGEVVVSAIYAGRTTSAQVFVLPRGTYRLSGTVKERGIAVPGVQVTVAAGVGEGLTTTSSLNGNYALYGVSGAVAIQLRRAGYQEGIHQVAVSSHGTADFDMVPDGTRADLTGLYTLTIKAASACSTLPDAARQRQYTASVTQDGPLVKVTLSDGDFIVTNGRGNSFSGIFESVDSVRFTIGDVYLYYDYFWANTWDIVERVDTMAILTAGVTSARMTATSISGKLNGSIAITSPTSPPWQSFSSWCGSPSHDFEMVRR